MKRKVIVAAVLLLSCALGCTNQYRPASAWEQKVMSESKFDVYPDDVKQDAAAYRNVSVAWAGLLVSAQINSADPDHPCVTLLIEHHYFDWIEDVSTQRQRYFLSPRGEGTFQCTWPFKKEWDLNKMRALMKPGDMIVAYGRPQSAPGGVVDLGQAEYVREIPQSLVATDILEYGRPGSPHRVLRTAEFN